RMIRTSHAHDNKSRVLFEPSASTPEASACAARCVLFCDKSLASGKKDVPLPRKHNQIKGDKKEFPQQKEAEVLSVFFTASLDG
ncbi:MAG: hypothetical protein IKZ20_04285, partial [Bacteroidaceae bacterium]|nr:hypothetical protein [Bacteroidaceae bacterium]